MYVDIECPYCWYENNFEIESEDYEDDWIHQSECEKCDKTFWTRMHIWNWYHSDEAIELPCTNWEWCKDFSYCTNWEKCWYKCVECWKVKDINN